MDTNLLLVKMLLLVSVEALVMNNDTNKPVLVEMDQDLDTAFNGVYSECILHLSYSCLQNKTLLYLRELNDLSEISIIGDYVKFVKLNNTSTDDGVDDDKSPEKSSDELAYLIDKAVDSFFDNHVIKFSGIERQISISNNVEEFVGRKKRKGGGGGHGGHGGDDGGKKKMMMMAMMCMKMKLMMMVPAMMGMMGMMSFKGMMFSMMSFMVSKMMLLMKILEKKGGAGGGLGGGGAGDGGWAAAGGGGAWMPAGGQDYPGAAGGGYDANGQWQSRSLLEKEDKDTRHGNNDHIISRIDNTPYSNGKKLKYNVNEYGLKLKRNRRSVISAQKYGYINNEPYLNFVSSDSNSKEDAHMNKSDNIKEFNNVQNGSIDSKTYTSNKRFKSNSSAVSPHIKINESAADILKHLNIDKEHYTYGKQLKDNGNEDTLKPKSNKTVTSKTDKRQARHKRSLMDTIQNAYLYWMNKILGLSDNRRASNVPKYRIANGVKYVYYPFRQNVKAKQVNLNQNKIKNEGFKVVNAEDFNKGEIVEGGIESRMNRKKFHKMKDAVNDTIEDNPWE